MTHAVFHLPIDMGRMFARVQAHVEAAEAFDPNGFLVLSKDLGAWTSKHSFAAARDVPDEDMMHMSGHFRTRVFDGSYAKARLWYDETRMISAAHGKPDGEVWFHYRTCPKCAKH